MLVEPAIGDAYGAGFEYAPGDSVARYNTVSGYVRHPRHALSPGAYTDDTQMALAVAAAILEGDEWTPRRLAARFVAVYQRDARPEMRAGGKTSQVAQ